MAIKRKVRVTCPTPDCGRIYNTKASNVGKEVRCKECNNTFEVTSTMIDATGNGLGETKGPEHKEAMSASFGKDLRNISDRLSAIENDWKKIPHSVSQIDKIIGRLDERITEAAEIAKEKPDSDEMEKTIRSGLESEVKPKIEALKDLLSEVDDGLQEFDLLAQNRRDFIRRYQPGRIEELDQRLNEKESELAKERDQSKAYLKQIGKLEIELQRCKAAGNNIDYEAIQRQWSKIIEEKQELSSMRELKDENDSLRSDLVELQALEHTYRLANDEQAFDQELRSHVAELELETRKLTHELSAVQKAKEAAEVKIRSLEAETERWRKDSLAYYEQAQQADTAIAELKLNNDELNAKLTRWREKDEAIKKQQADIESEKRHFEDRIRDITEDLKSSCDSERESLLAALEARKRALEDEKDAFREKVRAEVAASHEQEIGRLTQQTKNLDADLEHHRQLWEAAISKVKQANADREAWEIDTAKHEADRDLLDGEIERLQAAFDSLEERRTDLESKRDALSRHITDLSAQKSELEAKVESLREEIEATRRFKHDMEFQTTNRAQRIQSIEQRLFKDTVEPSNLNPESEADWLRRLRDELIKAEFYFPDRLLNAFHTSLKIADLSQLTVMAGVSGTGKSELPRLYSLFGGIRFLPMAVQPNWDSPQDIFGFYNYLEGRYKATDFLRALVQSQAPHDSGGFNEGLMLVLFDEMNIARPELYLSEMLSKLEMRRGRECTNDDIQCSIAIDLGALDGEDESYLVPLGRNVVYVGTINEDETTLSLSDKVLDRGNVISFPRPSKLKSRTKNDLASHQSDSYLSQAVWRSWIKTPETLPKDVREGVRKSLQQINHALQCVNRAIGHRVLQAIEMYVANHPGTSMNGSEWKTAFADQMVQKIMPKLRGIEIQSKDGERCLKGIQKVLKDEDLDIQEDFVNACQAARDGMFMWTSAGYLER